MVLCTIFLSFFPIYCGFTGQVYNVVKILKLFTAVLLLVLSIINKPIRKTTEDINKSTFSPHRLVAPVLSELEPGIHAHNALHKIPVSVQSDPVSDQDTSGPVAVALSITVLAAEVINRRGVQLRRNFLGPSLQLPEVACAQEVHVERVRLVGVAKRIASLTRAVTLLVHILDLLSDGLRLQDLVEVLDTDLSARTEGVGAVVGPFPGINAPATTLVFLLESSFNVEAAHEHNFAARFAQGGDLRVCVPPAVRDCVVVAQDAT